MRAAEAVRDGKAVGDDLGRQHRRDDGRRRCCGWAASRASAARRSPRRSRSPARRRRSCSTPAPTPRCSRSGWCSSPRWARCTPATASAWPRPKVGLLSIGEEPGKGDTLRKEAFPLLEAAAGIDFIGNVEGRDILTDDVDVVVTDGFTGNVVLKTLEGGVTAIVKAFARRHRQRPTATASTRDALLPALAPARTRRSTRTRTAAPCCSASTACASSPTARPAPRRCSTASGSPRRWCAAGSSTSCAARCSRSTPDPQ